MGRVIRSPAIGERAVDIGAPTQLGAKEEIYRVMQLFGEIDDRRIESDKVRLDRR